MRTWAALGAGLLSWLLAGCVSGPGGPSAAWRKRPPPPVPRPVLANFVQMDIALLECPAGDPYINEELWTLTDEQIVGPEQKSVLEDNGFRVAQLGGIVPAELQDLLTSKRSNLNPRRRELASGGTAVITLGPVQPALRCTVVQDGQADPVTLERAQCKLVVVPTLTADGRTCLHFTPQVEHGDELPNFHPASDGSGWLLERDRPRQSFPALGWEVTLAPNQYVVVGARLDCRQSLGQAGFVQSDEGGNIQRLLVIRANRPGGGHEAAEDDEDEQAVCASRSPPLALQALGTWSTARGSSP